MIKDSDLRFGNLLEYGDGYISVDINVLRDFNIYLQTGIKPIPITEEWILKSGKSFLFRFQTCWRGRFAYLKINGCRFMWFSDTNTIEVDGGEYILHSVHEFQNLFFSLAGEELVFSSTEP